MSSNKRTPPPPMATHGNQNPSWSPALQPIQEQDEISSLQLQPHMTCKGRIISQKEIISPQLLIAINRRSYMIRIPSEIWWVRVEDREEQYATSGDSFLCRRDEIEQEFQVNNPTEDEIPKLQYKKRIFSNQMAYFRTVPITLEYGSSYDGNGRWTRYIIAYLTGEESPYSFKKDCRDDIFK